MNRTNNVFHETINAFTPLFLYILVNMLASFLVSMGWVWYRGIDLSLVSDLNQIQALVGELLQEDYALINYCSMIVGYVIGIPLFAFLFLKDEKARVMKLTMDTDESGNKDWPSSKLKLPPVAYLILVIGGFATCVAGSNMVLLSGLNSEAVSLQEIENLMLNEGLFLQILIMGIGAPVMEELIFRGLIFKRFNRTSGILSSMFWSGAVFACLHTNAVQGVYALVIGFMLCFVYYRYRSLKAALLLHISINLSSIFLTETGILNFIYNSYTAFYGMTIFCLLVILACLYGIELWVRPVSEEAAQDVIECK